MVSTRGDEGHRRAYVAAARAGVICIALLASGRVYGQQKGQQEQHGHTRHQQNATSPIPAREAPSAYKSEALCDSRQSAEQENLCIEWRSANAADEQVVWTRNAFIVGVFGLIGVLLTLVATAWAAWAAWAAQRSAKAAEEVLSHARETSERELRAYVGIVAASAGIEPYGGIGRMQVSLDVKNAGKTPAKKVSIFHAVDLLKSAYEVPKAKMKKGISDISFLPEFVLHFKFYIDEPPERLDYEPRLVTVFGRIEYEDAFGEARWTNFRYTLGGDLEGGIVGFHPCPEGNDSN